MSELTFHLACMIDSLDEVVTRQDIHGQLIEALQLSQRQDDQQKIPTPDPRIAAIAPLIANIDYPDYMEDPEFAARILEAADAALANTQKDAS